MTGELDPTVLQLFDAKHQPVDAGTFTLQLAAALDREERQRQWQRRIGLGVVLLALGLGVPWMSRAAPLLLSWLAVDADLLAQAAELVPQWLLPALLGSITFGFTAIRRLLRRA